MGKQWYQRSTWGFQAQRSRHLSAVHGKGDGETLHASMHAFADTRADRMPAAKTPFPATAAPPTLF